MRIKHNVQIFVEQTSGRLELFQTAVPPLTTKVEHLTKILGFP